MHGKTVNQITVLTSDIVDLWPSGPYRPYHLTTAFVRGIVCIRGALLNPFQGKVSA